MAANPLPDPQWTDGPAECVQCGYALAGLQAPGVCPECGAPFDQQAMILHGIVNSAKGAPLWRKLAWVGVALGAFAISQTFVFFLVSGLWYIVVFLVVGVSGAAIALWSTAARERQGTERFMFTRAGIARLPKTQASGARTGSVFIPFAGANAVTLDVVSPVWRRLRIGTGPRPDAPSWSTIFDAGVRCPGEAADQVRRSILDLLPRPAHPPVAPPAPPSNTQSNPSSPGQNADS